MRETQAVRDEVATKLRAENERLKAELPSFRSHMENPGGIRQDIRMPDPFLPLLTTYLNEMGCSQVGHGHRCENYLQRENANPYQEHSSVTAHYGQDSERMSPSASTDWMNYGIPETAEESVGMESYSASAAMHPEMSHQQLVVGAGVVARRRRSLSRARRCSSASSVPHSPRASLSASMPSSSSEDAENMRVVLESCAAVHSRRTRRHSDMSYQLVVSAGAAAQHRRLLSRSQRCSSASSVPQSWRSSQSECLGLSSLMILLNSSMNNAVPSRGNSLCATPGPVSRLAQLVLRLLKGRPVEVATLERLLADRTTRARAEYFLRYTVVSHLVAQLQSPNSARVFTNVQPFLVESSSLFIEMVNKQHPVTTKRYSCPTFL
jgi:hypothetical protein